MKIREKYLSLTPISKMLFREDCMKFLQISYSLFYSWVQRDSVPKKYEEQFKLFIDEYESRRITR